MSDDWERQCRIAWSERDDARREAKMLREPCPPSDGETNEFYAWTVARAQALGWEGPKRAETFRDREQHPRLLALNAAAWMAGSESNEVGAQPALRMCAHELFTLLRDAWARTPK